MNFSCNKCQRRYSIADDKVRGKTVKVRCKNCQNVISVEGPPLEVEESTRVVSLEDVERLRAQDRSLAEVEASSAVSAQAAPLSRNWEDAPTRTMPLRDSGAPWFVMVKSKQEGPLDEGALRELVAAGSITSRSYFWQPGMPDWKRGQDIPELAGLFAPAAPPAPARAAPRPVVQAPEPLSPEPSTTSWQPEPPPPSQTTWQSEPAPAASTGAPLGELFSDLDLPQSEQQDLGALEGENPLSAPGEEPGKQRVAVENTQHFVKKAGGDRRNPPWKIALFIVLLLALPVGVLYLLTELQVVPLRVTRVDAQGHAVEQPVSVFSAEGVNELRNLMLGRQEPPPAPPRQPAPKLKGKERPSEPAKPEPEAAAAQPPSEAQQDAAALHAEGDEKDVGPEVREEAEVAAADPAGPPGPPQEEIARVVSRSQSAFKSCIEQALRKNPRLRDGKLLLTATVGSSGKVKKVAFDRKDLDSSPLGTCIKGSAKRMVFPAFSGDDVAVEVPLVITRSM